jgi:hypothetical protein
MIASLIALAAAAPAADCKPNEIQRVCAYQHSPRGITLKMLINHDQVRCGQIRSRGPKDRFPNIRAFTPRFPITTVTHGAPDKGNYVFQVNWQVRSSRTGACAVPFNFGGGAVQIIVR